MLIFYVHTIEAEEKRVFSSTTPHLSPIRSFTAYCVNSHTMLLVIVLLLQSLKILHYTLLPEQSSIATIMSETTYKVEVSHLLGNAFWKFRGSIPLVLFPCPVILFPPLTRIPLLLTATVSFSRLFHLRYHHNNTISQFAFSSWPNRIVPNASHARKALTRDPSRWWWLFRSEKISHSK